MMSKLLEIAVQKLAEDILSQKKNPLFSMYE